MTIAEWMSKMTIGDAARVAALVIVVAALSVPLIRIEMRRKGMHVSIAPTKAKMLYIAGFLTVPLLFVGYLFVFRNHISIGQ